MTTSHGSATSVAPYRGAPRPAPLTDRRSYTPPTLRTVTIEEIVEAAAKLRKIQKSLTFLLRTCQKHGITDLELRNGSPMGPLHRVHDFAIEAGQVAAGKVGGQ